MRECAFFNIWDALRYLVLFAQFKKREKHPWKRRVLLLVKLKASAFNSTKSNTFPWVFFMYFKLHKWYQIAQSIVYLLNHSLLGHKIQSPKRHNQGRHFFEIFWMFRRTGTTFQALYNLPTLSKYPILNKKLPFSHYFKRKN